MPIISNYFPIVCFCDVLGMKQGYDVGIRGMWIGGVQKRFILKVEALWALLLTNRPKK